MTYHVIWLLVAAAFFVVEAIVPGVVCIWFGLGALASFGISYLTDSIVLQIIVFLIVSVLLLIFMRKYALKISKSKESLNFDRVIEKKAIVIEDIENISGKGRVMIDGMEWKAKSENGEPVKNGETVIVKEIKGVTLIVEKI